MEFDHSTLYHAFMATSERDPNGVAWIEFDGDETQRRWRWTEWVDQVQRLAARLEENGIQAGDRIANLHRNGIDWALLDLACSAIGAIHAPLDSRLPPAWLHASLEHLAPKCIFGMTGISGVPSHLSMLGAGPLQAWRGGSSKPTSAHARRWERERDAHEVACILMTSGTTRHPRGVMLTHRNLLTNAAAKLEAMPQDANDVRLNFLPFAHAYARTCELSAWMLSGGTMACAHGIQDALRIAARLHPTLLNGVPSFYDALHRQCQQDRCRPLDALGGNLRRIASGGAPLSDPVRAAFENEGLPVFQGYGLTEASPVVCSNRDAVPDGLRELRGVGPPVTDVDVRIDADRRIWVRGPGVMHGYWNDPIATVAKIHQGWLDTGDLAAANLTGDREASECDAEGLLRSSVPLVLDGRSDDVQVLLNGCKFSPRPLEQCILQLEEVEHCILIGNLRRTPLLIVRPSPTGRAKSPETLLGMARETLDDAPEYARPTELRIDPEPWTMDNGRLHWKGGVNRRAIERGPLGRP
jgi:long-chain acyl-CoA synthetase